jgi:hypothetical protein
MSDSRQIRSAQNPGGQSDKRPGRRLELESKLFASTDQVVPLRIIHGRDRVAGVHVFPVFGLRAKKIQSKKGK